MLRLIIASTIVLAITLLYFFFDARIVSFFPHCPFHYLTGLFCPGCGSQRALSSLLHADIVQALSYNLLLVASLPFMIYAASVTVYNEFAVSPVQQKIFYSTFFVKTVFVMVVVYWIVRNINLYPFTLLAPHA